MIAISMRGALEPVLVDDDFMSVINTMNLAANQGKEFFLARAPDGEHIGFAMHNILTIKEDHSA